ncbi:hypothetical protein U9M48_004649 [Paspalum notatum var. saurae]|uniref:NB-ARC domain-containing protein n=1 Tax=Paspalum notatum var. saurae TaxID=547442 RepID=A0AAQ3SLF8_PASNO
MLKKIAREFGILVDVTYMEIRSLVDIINKHLEGKRYILVLYDVWQKDVWINDIMHGQKRCPKELWDLAKKFLQKCEGVLKSYGIWLKNSYKSVKACLLRLHASIAYYLAYGKTYTIS